MNRLVQILKTLKKAKNLFVIFASVLLLSACDDCSTIQDYTSEGSGNNCFLCPIFDILTESASQAADRSWGLFASDLAYVVLFATAIYIAFNTLKSVGSFGKQDASTYLTDNKKGILILIFKMTVIYLLLTDNDMFFVNQIIKPILEAGLDIGGTLASSGAAGNYAVTGSIGDGWSGLFSMVNERVVGYNDAIYTNIALGQSMICNATKDFIFFWYFLMLLYGLMFFVFGWFVLASVCFYIVDILINLAIASMLLPFGIAFMVSPKTVQHCQKIWNMFLDVFFNFMMLGVVMGLCIKLSLIAIGDESGASGTSGYGVVSSTDFSGSIGALLDGNQIEEASEILWSSGSLLLTIVCFCLITNLLDTLKSIVKSISGVEGVSSAGTQTATPMVKKATEAGKKMGGQVVNAGKYGGHVVARITRLDKGIDKLKRGATIARGFLTGTGSQGHRAWWRR